MAFSYWWFITGIEEGECSKQLEKEFLEADKLQFFSSQRGNQLQQKNVNKTKLYDLCKDSSSKYYNALGKKILKNDFSECDSSLVNEENMYHFQILNYCNPLYILFITLTPEIHNILPGFQGNMYIKNCEIEHVRKNYIDLINKTGVSSIKHNLVNTCSELNINFDCMEDILTIIPNALTRAQLEEKNLLCLSMKEV